jgi:uncharacterized protein YjbJ (UPF0337 family)
MLPVVAEAVSTRAKVYRFDQTVSPRWGSMADQALTRGEEMKASTKDKAEGKLREVEGALKDAVGAAARDRELQVEGKTEKKVGKVQVAVGRVEKAVGK